MDSETNRERGLFLAQVDQCLRNHRYNDALEAANRRRLSYPDDIDAQLAIGRTLLEMGRWDEAWQVLHALEDRMDQWSALYLYMGDISRHRGSGEEALQYYRKFITLNPDSHAAQDAALKFLDTHETEGRDATAVDREDKYQDIGDISPDFRTLTLAELYIKQGHLDMARDLLEEICRREPENQTAASMLNKVQIILGKSASEAVPPDNTQSIIAELERWLKNIEGLKKPDMVH